MKIRRTWRLRDPCGDLRDPLEDLGVIFSMLRPFLMMKMRPGRSHGSPMRTLGVSSMC